MHDEILSSVISEHDDCSSQVGFDVVELQKAQQVVRYREQHDPNYHKIERRVLRLLVPGQAVHCLYRQDGCVGNEDDLARK